MSEVENFEVGDLEKSRLSLLDSSLATLPFQLIPGAVYPPSKIEKGLTWQNLASESFPSKPKISVCVLDAGNRTLLTKTLESLACQSYQNIEVILPLVKQDEKLILKEIFQGLFLKPTFVQITEHLNATEILKPALDSATGTYFTAITAGEILHPQALFILAKEIYSSSPKLIYSNQLLLNPECNFASAFVRRSKPDLYSFLSFNGLGDFLVFEKSNLLERINSGNFKYSTLGILNWALACEYLISKEKIDFVPLALINQVPREPKLTKELSAEIAKLVTKYAKALELPLEAVDVGCGEFAYKAQPRFFNQDGRIQIVIPFKDNISLTLACIDSILKQDCLEECEITLVDNDSSAESKAQLKKALSERTITDLARIVPHQGYFNFATLNNKGASSSTAPYILFLNNDVQLKNNETISELRKWCALKDVGIVGGKLLYPNGRIQHGGINFAGVRPLNANCDDLFVNLAREVNGVTFAMAMVKREAFDALSGLDPLICPNGFGDCLFCHQLRLRGWKAIYTPQAIAIHHESKSRGAVPEELELLEMSRAGIPIADLFADFYAESQPMVVRFSTLNATVNKTKLKKAWSLVANGEWDKLYSVVKQKLS